MEQMRGVFRAEARDLLIELDDALLALETEAGDSTLVNRVFRAIHTIKGSGATAGFRHLAGFAHTMEEAFDLARENLIKAIIIAAGGEKGAALGECDGGQRGAVEHQTR